MVLCGVYGQWRTDAFRRTGQNPFVAVEWPNFSHYFDPSNTQNERFEGYLIYCHTLDEKEEKEDQHLHE